MLIEVEKCGFSQVQKLRDVIHFVSFLFLSFLLIYQLILLKIRGSYLRRKSFSQIFKTTPLQLLRDVETRWSSTYLMIKRAMEVKKVNLINLTNSNAKFKLGNQ